MVIFYVLLFDLSYWRGVEQGGGGISLLPTFWANSPSSLLFEPISPSSLNVSFSFSPSSLLSPLFLPPPNFIWAISPSSLFCSPLLLELSWWQVPNLRIFIFSNYWIGPLSRIWRILQINTLRDLQNSLYPTKTEFHNCFIIHSKYFPVLS